MPTAILIGGAFFLRRFHRSFPDLDRNDPKSVVLGLTRLTNWHLVQRTGPVKAIDDIHSLKVLLFESREFYRLFFYDCPPLTKRAHSPLSGKSINFEKTPQAEFRLGLHKEISSLRKAALRLGRLNDSSKWRLTEEATARLIKSPDNFHASDSDFDIDIKQKGVDMRLGIDVASLAFKRQVDQIVIVAADADFVPAAKLARREGIDVVLDRLGDKHAAKDLIQHVDGIRDCFLPNYNAS